MESNTPGTLTKLEDSLVDFDYETWQKFKLNLYWPHNKGDLSVVWPMRILAIRVHPHYQMVGLVKEGLLEEVVTFSKETGKDLTGRCALMDLNSPLDPVLRANSPREILWSLLKLLWTTIRMLKMIMWRGLKKIYHDYRISRLTT